MSRALLSMWSFQDNIQKRNFYTAMENLWKENFLSDVTVRCGDMTFSGHKVMLAASSSYFKKLFEKETGNEFTIVPTNQKCSPKAVMFLLNFVYSTKIDIEVEDKAELLAAADLLEMAQITQIVFDIIINNFECSKFLNDWDLVQLHCKNDCINQFVKRVVHSFGNVIEHHEFLNLSRDRLISILECMHQGSLWQTISTDQLTRGVMKWIKFTNTRAPFLPELISLIDINKLSLPWLINLAEEEPSLTNIVIKPLFKKLWKRDEVLVFLDDLKTTHHRTNLSLRLLNPTTNSWLTCLRQLPKTFSEESRSICNWQQYIYSITETSITIFNIESESVFDIKCKLSSFDRNGKSVATEENLYFISKNGLEKYDLKSNEESWITLPAPLKDIVCPNIFCAHGHLYVISNNLLIQRFKFETNEWDLIENFLLTDKIYSNVVFYLNEVKGRLYVYQLREPDVLQILDLQSIMSSDRKLGQKRLSSKCPLLDVRLMRVEELGFPMAFKLLMVDSKGKQWTYNEDANNGIAPLPPIKIPSFNFNDATNLFGSTNEKGNTGNSLPPNQDVKVENEKRDAFPRQISTNLIKGFTHVNSFERKGGVFVNTIASSEKREYAEKRKDQSNVPSQQTNPPPHRSDFTLAEAFIGRINIKNMN